MKLVPSKKKQTEKKKPRAKVKQSRKGIPRFVFELEAEDRQKLHEIAKWYSQGLKEKVSAAYLVRKAIKKLIREEADNLKKAAKGVLHAKPRKHTER